MAVDKSSADRQASDTAVDTVWPERTQSPPTTPSTPDTPAREQERLAHLRTKAARAYASYDPKHWASHIVTTRGRSGHHVWQPLLWVLLVSIFAAWSAQNAEKLGVSQRRWNKWLLKIEPVEALLRLVMSFLLVFRLGRSAQRYWEARQKAGALIEVCRAIASTACAHMIFGEDLRRIEHRMHWPKVPPSEEKEEEGWMSTTCSPASAICRWVVVFPIAAKNYLRSEGGDPKELDGLLSTGEVDELFQAPNQCLYVLDTMRGLSASWAAKAVANGACAEVVAQVFGALTRQIDLLTGTFGGMERINNTPLPFVYVSHLRTSLTVYLTLVPIVFAPIWLWATPPLTLIVAWALLGIEAAAVECERPVRGCANHMPLEAFCAVVADNVRQTLQHSASMGAKLRTR